MVFDDAPHTVVTQAGRGFGLVSVVNKFPLFPVEPVQSVFGSDPEQTAMILKYGPDMIMAQALRKMGIVLISDEHSLFPVKLIQSPTLGSDPEHSLTVLV